MRKQKMTIRDYDVKGMIEKDIMILVVQLIIFGLFIVVDPGFYHSLLMYFTIVAIVSVVLISWVHIHSTQVEFKTSPRPLVRNVDAE